MFKRIRWWWRQPGHYLWFGSYLEARRMVGMTRGLIAVISASLAALSLAMLWSSAAPDSPPRILLALLSITGGAACALLWIVRWPTKPESIGFVVVASASIAAAALSQGDPMIALLTCTAFATISAYVAIFHAALLLVVNAVVAVGVPIIPAMALTESDGLLRGFCGYGLVVVVNITVPFGIQMLVHALGVDLLRVDHDPLTGLLNRRAFYERAGRLVSAHRQSEARLVVAMIDLDRFKRLNDTQGHAAGDRALIAVGNALREHARPSAIVGRVGGEEFLVADVFVDPRGSDLGQRLCDAVATLPYGITASVGTVSARCDDIVVRHELKPAIAALIASADEAMYDAKRNGGNQSRQRVGSLDELSR